MAYVRLLTAPDTSSEHDKWRRLATGPCFTGILAHLPNFGEAPAGVAALAAACVVAADNAECLKCLLRPGFLERLARSLVAAAADASAALLADHGDADDSVTLIATSLRRWHERALVIAATALYRAAPCEWQNGKAESDAAVAQNEDHEGECLLGFGWCLGG